MSVLISLKKNWISTHKEAKHFGKISELFIKFLWGKELKMNIKNFANKRSYLQTFFYIFTVTHDASNQRIHNSNMLEDTNEVWI